jgi:hypothetical protein
MEIDPSSEDRALYSLQRSGVYLRMMERWNKGILGIEGG